MLFVSENESEIGLGLTIDFHDFILRSREGGSVAQPWQQSGVSVHSWH